MKITLTASSMACALRCPRRYWYDNILGLKEVTPSEALRIGTAVHNGGEARAKGADFEAQYAAAITGGTLDEWMAAKVFGILGAYDRTYGEIEDRDCAEMEPEVEFIDPIDGSRTFEQRGKVDGLAVMRDGRRVVWERKTTSEDVGDTADYWNRLKFNIQLLAYAGWVYHSTGELPVCVYDVIRKPALQPKANIPDLDENGLPIVLDANGQRCIKRDGTPKKTADAAKGEKVSGHPETPDEYGSRILESMTAEADRSPGIRIPARVQPRQLPELPVRRLLPQPHPRGREEHSRGVQDRPPRRAFTAARCGDCVKNRQTKG